MLNKNNYKDLLKENRGNNYNFLEDYKGSTKPINCQCNICKNIWKVAPYEIIIRKSNCPECSKKSSNNKKRKGLEYYKNKLKKFYGYDPYTFLTEDYSNPQSLIKVKCNKCNYEFESDLSHLMRNVTLKKEPLCKNCYNNKRINNFKYNKETYQKLINNKYGKNSYIVLEDYKGYDVPILHKCLICNYIWKVSPGNIINRRCCPSCNNMIRTNLSYEEKLNKISSNLIPLEDYKGRAVKILHKCKYCGYEWKALPNNTLKGSGCPICAKKIIQSSYEKNLIDFLKNICNIKNIVEKDRNILEGKEIDIYLPDYKLGIEIDGTYYHSERYKDKNYHINKTNLCKEKGIRLIHIFDDELKDKKELVYKKIKHILKLNNNLPKIYARKCYVEEIDNNFKREFLLENHIQGSDSSNIKLGLWYPSKDGDILVSVMTFCKPRKSLGNIKDIYDYELSRFANDNNYIVVGSFGKLFNYFKNNYDFNKIVTYADLRWSQGEIYYKNGFILDHISKPNYWYIDKNTKKRYHRYNFRKNNLKKLFPKEYNDNLTEEEIMKKTNYLRLYDCGNMVFTYSK